MPDIFDQAASSQQSAPTSTPKGDIFDSVTAKQQADIFDKVAPDARPNLSGDASANPFPNAVQVVKGGYIGGPAFVPGQEPQASPNRAGWTPQDQARLLASQREAISSLPQPVEQGNITVVLPGQILPTEINTQANTPQARQLYKQAGRATLTQGLPFIAASVAPELVPEMEGAGLLPKLVNPATRISTQAAIGAGVGAMNDALDHTPILSPEGQRRIAGEAAGYGAGQILLGEAPNLALSRLAKMFPKPTSVAGEVEPMQRLQELDAVNTSPYGDEPQVGQTVYMNFGQPFDGYDPSKPHGAYTFLGEHQGRYLLKDQDGDIETPLAAVVRHEFSLDENTPTRPVPGSFLEQGPPEGTEQAFGRKRTAPNVSGNLGLATESEPTTSISTVRPDDFIEKVSRGPISTPIVEQYRARYAAGQPVEPVQISFDENGNVVDANGRHRALAAKQAGVERIPIQITNHPAVTSASGRTVQVPQGRTTGQFDDAIRQGGAIPAGLQRGIPGKLEDVAMFHDPQTGSTLGLPASEISPEGVAQKLATSRAEYAAKAPQPAPQVTAQSAIVPPRDYVSFAEQRRLADHLGMSVDELLAKSGASGVAAEHIVRGTAMLDASVQRVQQLAERASNAGPDSPEMKALFNALSQHKVLTDQVRGKLFGEAGRALGATRNNALASTIADIASDLDRMTPAQRAKIATKLGVDPQDTERIAELSAIQKHLRTINEQFATLSPKAKARASELFAKIDPTNVGALARFAAEIKPSTTGAKLYEAWINALLTGGAIFKKAAGDTMMALAPMYKALGGDFRGAKWTAIGMAAGRADAIDAMASTFANEVSKAHNEFDSPTIAIKGRTGKIVRLPMRSLAALTDFYHAIHYSGSIAEQSAKIAHGEGLRGDEFLARVQELRANPSREMRDIATEYAKAHTFQSAKGPVVTLAKHLRNTPYVGKVAFPFAKTPANIAQEAARFGPWGVPVEVIRSLRNGGEINAENIGKSMLGTAALAWAISKAAKGQITGNGSQFTPEQRRAMEAQGWQPYSVKIGNHYVSIRNWEPVAPLLQIAGDIGSFRGLASFSGAQRATGRALIGTLDALKTLPFMYSITDLANAIQAAENPGTGAQKFGRYMGQQFASVIPTGVADIARATDRTVRMPQTFEQEFEARIPGLTKRVPALASPTGKPIQRPVNELGGFNPFPVSKYTPDPAEQEIFKVQQATSKQRKPTAQAQADAAFVKRQVLDYVRGRMSDPDWKGMTPAAKRRAIDSYSRRLQEQLRRSRANRQ